MSAQRRQGAKNNQSVASNLCASAALRESLLFFPFTPRVRSVPNLRQHSCTLVPSVVEIPSVGEAHPTSLRPQPTHERAARREGAKKRRPIPLSLATFASLRLCARHFKIGREESKGWRRCSAFRTGSRTLAPNCLRHVCY